MVRSVLKANLARAHVFGCVCLWWSLRRQRKKTLAIKSDVKTVDKAWHFLVVDDHPLNRLLVRQVLQNAWPHSQVLEAVDGQKALEIVRTQAVDLVLMDMVMPVLDGIAATVAMRQDVSDVVRRTPVMGLTANVNPQDLERFEAAGLNDLMLKPFEPIELCAKVEALLCESVPLRAPGTA